MDYSDQFSYLKDKIKGAYKTCLVIDIGFYI